MLPVLRKDKIELTLKVTHRFGGLPAGTLVPDILYLQIQLTSVKLSILIKSRKYMLSITSYQLSTLSRCTSSSESVHPAPFG